MQRLILTASTIAVFFVAGCGKCADKKSETKTPPPKSTMQTAVEGFTGKTAVDASKKAQQQIRDVSEKSNKNLNEVLEQ